MEHVLSAPVLVLTRLHAKLHLRAAEWLTAMMLFTWGGELLLYPSLFQRPFFDGFLQLAPQSVWAAALLLISALRITALFINGSWRYSAHMRCVLLVLSVWLWAGLVRGIWASNLSTIGVVLYPWLALIDIYTGYRAGRDARLAMSEVHFTFKVG